MQTKKSAKRKVGKRPMKRSSRKKSVPNARRHSDAGLRRARRSTPRDGASTDEVLRRFEKGESIADSIDFSAGKFVRIP